MIRVLGQVDAMLPDAFAFTSYLAIVFKFELIFLTSLDLEPDDRVDVFSGVDFCDLVERDLLGVKFEGFNFEVFLVELKFVGSCSGLEYDANGT